MIWSGRLVKRHKRIMCSLLLDNTWGAGFNVLILVMSTLSVDVTVHALTKYPSGGVETF